METLTELIYQHIHHAHYLIFGLLLLAGLNIPISEDVLLLIGGGIVSTVLPENYTIMLLWLYLGCIISAYEAYWLGRLAGPRLYCLPWINRFINVEKVEKMRSFFERYGILTFFVGRFIPGGVRNVLFMSSGLAEMPFLRFILRDGLAAMLSTYVLFTLGYTFGKNLDVILSAFKEYETITIALMASGLGLYGIRRFLKSRKQMSEVSID